MPAAAIVPFRAQPFLLKLRAVFPKPHGSFPELGHYFDCPRIAREVVGALSRVTPRVFVGKNWHWSVLSRPDNRDVLDTLFDPSRDEPKLLWPNSNRAPR